MARMSDFHVVGDPRYAPDAPGGGGGVSQEYVDNADLEVKRTAAKAHSTKYDETVIPSQYANKLYVYNDPESMYKASEQGESGEGFFESGNVVIHHHNDWDWGDVSNTTYRRYDDAYKGLAIVKATPLYATEAQILDKFYYYMIVAGDGTQLVITDNNVLASVNGWSLYHSTVERDDGDTEVMFNFSAYDAIPTHSLPYPQAPDFWNGILFVSANLPVFDLDTQAGVDAFNTYQTTGDYSGAINYSDLNPLSPDSFVAIDVISGDWYVIVNDAWVKQGTLDLNETGGTEVEANPQGTPTDTLNTIEIDGTVYDIAGGGGSGSGSEIIPITAGDDTTSRTFTFTKQPKFIKFYWMGSGWDTDATLVWGQSYMTYMAHEQYVSITGNQGGIIAIAYGNDGKSITITGGNPFGAFNNSDGSGYMFVSYGGGSGGGASNLSDLSDVELTNLSDGQILQYNSTTEKWENADNQDSVSAEDVTYDNTQSDLTADNTQDAIDELADEKADKSTSLSGYGITDAYTKSETDTLLNAKANTADLGTASAKNFTTSVTQGSNDLVTSSAVWTAIDNLPEPMIFKGTLGTNGTITTLPTASSSNEGWTYKVITAGTYAGQVAKVGDLFSSNATEWVYIPSGDETDTDTWRGINVNGSQLLGNGISSGNVNFKSGTNAQVSGSGNDVTVDVDTTFTDASSRTNIASGDSIKTILGKIKKYFADLKTVAFTNSYTDLDNKPTIPTVNNATLNIKKNGTSQGTFTANASTDVNVDISVPTKIPDIADGFSSQSKSLTWGNQIGEAILRLDDVDGGSLGFRKNNPLSGQMSMVIDGTVYVNEGRDEVSSNVLAEIPVTTSPQAGWRRLCKINRISGKGYCTGFLTITGGWDSGIPSIATIKIDTVNNDGRLTLLSNLVTTGMIQQVRLVNAVSNSNVFWIDAYMKAQTGSVAKQSFYFNGLWNITDIQNSATIITDTVTAIDTIDLTKRYVYGNYITDSYFKVGNASLEEHNCNNMTVNGMYYYTSNGPATSLGASTNDGAVFVQAYSNSWLVQIAQDYRNGRLFVRSRNNGTWQGWKRIIQTVDTSPLIITPTEALGSYDEGLRINTGTNGYADILLGGTGNTGTRDGAFWIGVWSSDPRKLWITHGASKGNTYFGAVQGQTSPYLNLGSSGSISSGNTQAVTGGAVYDYHNSATVDLGNQVYLEKSGNVVNIEICGIYGNDIANKTIPEGYRPKRQLRIPARFVDSAYNETVGTFVINTNGKIAAQYQTVVPGAMNSLTTSIYRVYCNATYII